MTGLDLTEAIEAAARAYFDTAGVHFDTLKAADRTYARVCMAAALTAAAPLIRAQVRAQIAADIEDAAGYVCPTHRMPDCSPLLNGCSIPSILRDYRDRIAARVARGES